MANSNNKTVSISKKPAVAVTGLKAPTRSETSTDLVFTASWTYPDAAFNNQKDNRFEGVLVKWIVDYDMGSTNVKKNRKKNASLTNTKKRVETIHTLSGKNKTSDTFYIKRNQYYPFASSKKTYIQLYQATKAKWNSKTNKWIIQKKSVVMSKTLSEINTLEKNGTVCSQSKLVKLPKNTKGGILGRTYYISKKQNNNPHAYTIEEGYPVVDGIGVQIQGWNAKSSFKPYKVGKGKNKKDAAKANAAHVIWTAGVPVAEGYFNFLPPPKPVMGTPTIAGPSNITPYTVTFPIDASNDDGTVKEERYQSRIIIKKDTAFYDTSYDGVGYEGGVLRKSSATILPAKGGNEGQVFLQTSLDQGINPNDHMPNGRSLMTLRPNEYLKFWCSADNQGISGDSGEPDNWKEFLIARPHDVAITEVKEQGSYYRVSFNIGGGVRKTSGYRLERLYNYRPQQVGDGLNVDDWSDEQWSDAADKEPDSSWTDTGLTLGHTGGAQSFTELIINAKPIPFRRTYYRVVPFNEIEGLVGTPSKAYAAPGYLKIPSAASQTSKIVSCSSAENGNSIMAVVAFYKSMNESGYYNSNGTEMTWDTFAKAWQSSTLPSSYDFKDDTVGPIKVTEARKQDPDLEKFLIDISTDWCYAVYYLRGVQSSKKYYVKARRFLKDTETRETDSYGSYAEYSESGAMATVEVKAVPAEVKIEAPERLVAGKDLSVSWTYDSTDVQKSFHLASTTGTGKAALDEAEELLQKDDSAPYAVVPWSTVEQALVGPVGMEDHLYVTVRLCAEEGNWSEFAEPKVIRIVRPPKASIGQLPTLSSRVFENTFGTDDPTCSIVVRIVSHQLSGWGPMGKDDVAEGSVVYTTKIRNVPWAETLLDDGTKWYYYNHLFSNVDLRSGGSYIMEYTAVNDELDLSSDTVDELGNVVKQTTEFNVKYEEELEVPQFYVVADPVNEDHGGSTYISVMDTPGVNDGCVVDLYRVTPDGSYPVKAGVENWRDATFIDTLPPYSRHEPCVYRLAIRTTNGIVEWSDRSYAVPGYSVRFDWGEAEDEEHGVYGHLTLPYNLKWSDSWTKNSRVELHLDGTYNGYWRGGVDHKNTLSTELVKLTGAEQVARVRALARYAGPVFVRLPNGCAFYADVQVSNLDVSYDSLTIAASFSAQEIRPSADILESKVSLAGGLYKPVE